ncbi:MAG TPA: cysteine--tRNA ligase [Phycisphaerales bacterium]|nr:cysteine--tRNA ligase [Phycisphaerales bacterium]
MPLRLYNTLTRTVEPLRPIDPARVTFYTCGPTVYDDAHIGNFRSFLAADVLRRFVESPLCELDAPGTSTLRGGSSASESPQSAAERRATRTVVHVMNITDVGHMTDDDAPDGGGEDKMAVAGKRILEQKKSGKLPADSKLDPNNPYDVAEFYAARFLEDARALGLKVAIEAAKDPTLMPRATANVPGMVRVIDLLIQRGHAYVVGTPGSRVVYFNVKSFPAYGTLSGNTLDSLREGAGGRIATENQSGKKHPADFLLWKEDPSHLMKWDSPWGPGYPGWHIECTVMSAARLGGPALRAGSPLSPDQLAALVIDNANPIIDIHSGGEDNIFPHHECELAQSCCAFNASHTGSFAGMWFHPRFLFVEGAKMSKSKGNFFTARDLFAKGHEAAAVRLELIRTHYRSNANFTEQGLKDSQRMVDRWRRFAAEGAGPGGTALQSRDADPALAEAQRAFADALHDDLNIAGAIAAVNTFASTTPSPAAAALMRTFDGVLGVLELKQTSSAQTDIGVFIGCDPDPVVIARLHDRVNAKKAKDFATSDAIRDELARAGYAIKDVAGGKVEVRRA